MPLYNFKCAANHAFEHHCSSELVDDLQVPCTADGCKGMAVHVYGFGGLDHGIGLFSDLAKEGRFDEDNLPTRYMSSGRAARPGK